MLSVTERSDIQACDTGFPPFARHFVRDVLDAHGFDVAAPSVDLAVSELVTYALVAAEFDRAWIAVTFTDDAVRISVVDPASLFAAVVEDLPLSHTLRSGGIGLLVVDSTAQCWGVDALDDGSEIWLELDRPTLVRS